MRSLRLMAEQLKPAEAPQAAFCARRKLKHDLEVHKRAEIPVVILSYEALVTMDVCELVGRAWEDVARVKPECCDR